MGMDQEAVGAVGVGVELVLRKWEEMNPSREFRCFVRNDILIGKFPHVTSVCLMEESQIPSSGRTDRSLGSGTWDMGSGTWDLADGC